MRFLTFLTLLLTLHFSFSQNYSHSTIPEELVKNADAVVRLDQMSVVVKARNLMVVSSKRVVTVLNEKGDRYVHAYAFYDKSDKIIRLEAKIYNKQGEEIKKIKRKEFFDQSAVSGGTLYSDSRVQFMKYTPTNYPYTVEFVKEYSTPNTAFIPSWSFVDGYRVSTEESNFTFSIESGINVRYKESNLEPYSIKVNKTTNRTNYLAKDIKAFKREPLSPSFNEFSPTVKIALDQFHLEGVDGTAKTWKEFGKWIYDELLVGQDVLNPQTIDQVQDLVKGVDGPKEKIKRVYNFVQDNTRYISVQLGIGGWMPISASEVDRVKYGDCKGLTNYTMALLKSIGIDSYYTVVYAGSQKRDFDPDFPMIQGNHAFLNIPLEEGNDIWLECTSQTTPVNHLGTFTDNRNVLRVTPSGGEIVKTKVYLDKENYQLTKAEYFADTDGKIDGRISILSTGTQYNQKYRQPSKSKVEQEEYYKKYWGYVNNLSLQNISFKNDKEEIIFEEELEITAENYLSPTEEKLLFAPNISNRNLAIPERCRNRKRELVIFRGYLDEDEFTIHLPDNYKPETLIQPVNLETKFGNYQVELTEKTPGVLQYNRRLLIKSGRYAKEDYESYRNFRKQIARYDNSRIVLTKI
ncbi:DUF3857 domain-containing protein [Flagellimonas sp. CMM7]|uniref:DUF3857 domain-containing protein n=1 Tax=Flagellimonas sp. CMM7 TaxID=2654676 RepID=UPI0013D078B5|nr:DUF3857 domain-containing protein [Flagellimonas sp. CMM7]UII80728.1 DUF3857 domain-containing transglutaminase family protein [Flagellimonas sp. CMM7]